MADKGGFGNLESSFSVCGCVWERRFNPTHQRNVSGCFPGWVQKSWIFWWCYCRAVFFIIYLCLDTAVYCNMDSESDHQHKAADVNKKGRVGVRVLVRVERFGFTPIHCSFHSSSPCFIIWTHLVSLHFSQWEHQCTFFSCSPPIKRCVPPASKLNDFISKTCAGSVPPVSYIFFTVCFTAWADYGVVFGRLCRVLFKP